MKTGSGARRAIPLRQEFPGEVQHAQTAQAVRAAASLVALGEGVRQRQAARRACSWKGDVADALQVAVVQTEALQERAPLQRSCSPGSLRGLASRSERPGGGRRSLGTEARFGRQSATPSS